MIGDKIIKNNKGYALIEMIVSIALFAFVFLSITNIYSSVIQAQQSAIASQIIQSNMKFVIEMMSKEIRSAPKNTLGGACAGATNNKVFNTANSASELIFENKYGQCVRYRINNNAIEVFRDAEFFSITPNDLYIDDLRFDIVDDIVGYFHSVQPRVTVRMTVQMRRGKEMNKRKTEVQTTFSSRAYE